MSPDLELNLKEKFPTLLDNAKIACQDGWYQLFFDFCTHVHRIEGLKVIRVTPMFGFMDITINLEENFEAKHWMHQVKKASFKFCEQCGSMENRFITHLLESSCNKCGCPCKLCQIT